MIEMAIIADDLTGAADTGVQFCPYFMDTTLMPCVNLQANTLPATSGALAIYTNTRSLTSGEARERIEQVSRRLLTLNPRCLYKKVDSCLRGNIGAEVDAVLDEMDFELSFIAPAFPEMGRTTLHDIHRVNGIPVSQTELSQDPVTPVTESRLSRVVAAKSRYRVGHVDVRFYDPGDDSALKGEVSRLARGGAKHLVFDAESESHLDQIALLARTIHKKALLVGSAGLADSLGRQFPVKMAGDGLGNLKIGGGSHLLVCGTVSKITKEQIAALIDAYPYEVFTLEPGVLSDSTRRDELLTRARSLQSLLSENHLILRVRSAETGGEEPDKKDLPWTAAELVEGLGALVAEVLKETKPAGLFLSGGDTAHAVLKSIGATGIRLMGEIVPGMAQGTLIGGIFDSLPVVTKAGAFGKKETLVALHGYWADRAKEDRDEH